MKEFKNKVAVVTGGASGIGLGLAEQCVREGMKVVLADIEEPALKDAEKTLKNSGVDVLAVPTDVSKYSDIENLAQRTIEAFGGVRLLFYFLVVFRFGRFERTPRRVFENDRFWQRRVHNSNIHRRVGTHGMPHDNGCFNSEFLNQGDNLSNMSSESES